MPNYPTSLDTLTNPTSSDTLASPAHATQHTDANDIVEALETKLGIGASVPTTTGHVLTVTGAGATAYQAAGGGASDDLKQLVAYGGLSFVAGRYYDGSLATGTPSTVGISGSIYYFNFFYTPLAQDFDRCGINVTATGTATAARLGYYAHTSGAPGALIADLGTVDVTGTGGKEVTISESLSDDTGYWFVVVANGTMTISSPAITAQRELGLDSLAAAGYLRMVRDAAGTAYGALVDPAPAVTPSGSLNAPSIRLRAA